MEMGGYGPPQPKKRKSKKGDDSDPDEVSAFLDFAAQRCVLCLCLLVYVHM